MAKVNYNFEKRQKEIARKKKQEQKLAEKRQRKADAEPDQPAAETGADTVSPPPADV